MAAVAACVDDALDCLVKAWAEDSKLSDAMVLKAFKKFDENGDGVLSLAEMTSLVRHFDERATDRCGAKNNSIVCQCNT